MKRLRLLGAGALLILLGLALLAWSGRDAIHGDPADVGPTRGLLGLVLVAAGIGVMSWRPNRVMREGSSSGR